MFGFATTVEEVIDGVDLRGKTAVVTGASSGLGLATVSTLASAGADVIATVRSPEHFATTGDWAQLRTLAGSIELVALDLSALSSVRAATELISARHAAIDILINNAGVMFTPHQTTSDGFEFQFGVNHLCHYLLTTLLLPHLINAGGARVVTVSSEAHRFWGIDCADINFERRAYDPFLAYGQSKSANILMTVELDRRHRADGITAVAVHPGICSTNLGRHMDRATAETLFTMGAETLSKSRKSVAQAAATSVWGATAASLSGHGGAYLIDCQLGEAAREATDPATARQLWLRSREWVDSAPSL